MGEDFRMWPYPHVCKRQWECAIMYYWYSLYYSNLESKLQDPSEPRVKARKLDGGEPAPAPITTSLKANKAAAPGKLGFISFRPHSDETGSNSAKCQSGNKRRYEETISAVKPFDVICPVANRNVKANSKAVVSSNTSKLNGRTVRRRRQGQVSVICDDSGERRTTVASLLPECLEKIFSCLDITSKGRAAQVRQ